MLYRVKIGYQATTLVPGTYFVNKIILSTCYPLERTLHRKLHTVSYEIIRRRWTPGRFYARSENCEKRLLDSSCLSAWINSAHTGRTVIKFENIFFFRKSVEKTQVSLKLNKNSGYFTWRPVLYMKTGTLHEDRYFTWRPLTLLIVSRSVLFRMRNVSDKSRRQNQNTHFMS